MNYKKKYEKYYTKFNNLTGGNFIITETNIKIFNSSGCFILNNYDGKNLTVLLGKNKILSGTNHNIYQDLGSDYYTSKEKYLKSDNMNEKIGQSTTIDLYYNTSGCLYITGLYNTKSYYDYEYFIDCRKNYYRAYFLNLPGFRRKSIFDNKKIMDTNPKIDDVYKYIIDWKFFNIKFLIRYSTNRVEINGRYYYKYDNIQNLTAGDTQTNTYLINEKTINILRNACVINNFIDNAYNTITHLNFIKPQCGLDSNLEITSLTANIN